MSTALLIKGLFAAVIGGVFAWLVVERSDSEMDTEGGQTDRQRYLPYVPSVILPLFIAMCVILAWVLYGGKAAAQMTLSLCFGIFLHICLYDALLLALLPLMRRYFSARACAMLWIIPNYLYFTAQSFMQLPAPKLVICGPAHWIWALFGVWVAGFAGVFGWKLIAHLLFRARVLQNADAVTDPDFLEVWNAEIRHANFKKVKYRLVRSPNIVTPLSIGLFKRTIRVVLPERVYTKDELAMILRHELIHIGREDAWSKFFLVFCTAMCWFNPLMWIAMRKSADDLELSCDETVLLGCDDRARHRYADLLLRTAGDERGFTTCLSASASALRYRLKNVVQPAKKRSGALLVGLVFFLLCMSCGYVALAYGGGTGDEMIYQNQDASGYHVRVITMENDTYDSRWLCRDQEAFHAYMKALDLRQLTGNYAFDDGARRFSFIYDTPQGTLGVILSGSFLKVAPLYGDSPSAQWYYIAGGLDWNTLLTIIVPRPALNLVFQSTDASAPKELGATLYALDREENGQVVQIVVPEGPLDFDASGLYGYGFRTVTLDFSHQLASDFKVEIASMDGKIRYTVAQSELGDPSVLPLAPFDARYTVYAVLEGENGSTYSAIFRFDVGGVEA